MMNYKILPLPIEIPDNWEQLLYAERREKALSLRSPQQRMESIAAYLLLSEMVRKLDIFDNFEKKGNLAPLELLTLHNGKPYLKDFPNVQFNFSHCRVAVACAVSENPVGIDIERIRPYKPALARKVLSQEELQAVESSENPARAFIRLWTKKEALLKLTGEGIRSNLREVLINASVRFLVEETEDFVCTVAYY